MHVALAIIALTSIGLARLADRYATDVKNTVVADQLKRTAEAARSYIKDNYSTIVATATSSTPFLITNTMLVSAGYLPTGTPATNGFGQSTCTLVLQPSANKLQGLVVAEGGTTVDDVTLGALVSLIGSSAGSVLLSSPSTITGAMGGWSIPVATYDNRTNNQNRRCDGTTSGAVRVQVGHNAVALWFENSFAQASTLYRDAVPGQPQLNTMNTPIVFNSTQTVGAACTSSGALANDASGAVINCTGGAWKSIGGSMYWGDPAADFASLGTCSASALGVTKVARTPGPRAYTCDGSSWVALAVDNSGNLTVPGTLTAGKVSLNDVVTAGAACSTTGQVSRDSTGQILSCQSGTWKSMGGADGLGYGQTWQFYIHGTSSGCGSSNTGQRNFNVDYVNTTAKPIMASWQFAIPWGGYALVYLNYVMIAQIGVANGFLPYSVVIPPGGTYTVGVYGATPTICTWAELR